MPLVILVGIILYGIFSYTVGKKDQSSITDAANESILQKLDEISKNLGGKN